MGGHDYTDSEPEIDPDELVQDHDELDDDQDQDTNAASPTTAASNASPTKAPRSRDSGQSLKITLRPNLASSSHAGDEGTPPPPHSIKLKLGMKHSIASYSSSEDEGNDDRERSPPAKKQRVSKKSKASPSKDSSNGREGKDGSAGPSMPAPHRKAYDWLPSSAAGASHHGPPDRHHHHDDGVSDTGTDTPSIAPEKEAKPRKSGGRKRAPDAPPGPGKNWRKGMRKGDPIPWKEGATFLGGEGRPKSSPLSTPARASASRDVSPESLDGAILAVATGSTKKKSAAAAAAEDRARSPSPPFVLADAAKLGFPVFANPIVAPKIALSSFPKVTNSFAPFDSKPFRKEKVREWSYSERTLGGIGGGTLKFKTWARGPQSEFGVIAAQIKEAELLAKQKKKEAKELETREGSTAATERPLFGHSQSSESVPQVGDESELISEAGDVDDSILSIASASPTPTPRGRGKKAKPRKSKLAQEIVPDEIE